MVTSSLAAKRIKTKKRDVSGIPKNKLPPIPERDICVYHWSPSKNRKQIERYGLRVGMKTLQGDWRPPYVCFSDDPVIAWALSGAMWPSIEEWDLWMVNVEDQTSFTGWEMILDTWYNTGRRFIKEYRVYTRVYKRDLHYIGTRRQDATDLR